MSSATSSGAYGRTWIATDAVNIAVDQLYKPMYIEINAGNDFSGSIGWRRAIVFYHLQVSPAPATADFGDVPTTSPRFQFIEALYAAGVTAGYGGGNYCPDTPVTEDRSPCFSRRPSGFTGRTDVFLPRRSPRQRPKDGVP